MIHTIALLGCGLISVVLGMVWFGPVFGKKYRAYLGVTPEMEQSMRTDQKMKMQMIKSSAVAFVASILTAIMLSGSIMAGKQLYGVDGLRAAVLIPFFNWLGFVVPPTLGMVLWERRKCGHWVLVAAFWLIYMVCAGIVIVYTS